MSKRVAYEPPHNLAALRALLENTGEDPGGDVMMGLADLEACDDEYGLDSTFGPLLLRVWKLAETAALERGAASCDGHAQKGERTISLHEDPRNPTGGIIEIKTREE